MSDELALSPATAQLVDAVQALAAARDLEEIEEIATRGARAISASDGAALLLREGEFSYYANEEAIGPLWRGRRFPLRNCIGGWVMKERRPVVIEDILADRRIASELYRPTFVRSLAMVPIRSSDPLGAIGTYWAAQHRATPGQVRLLQALADTTAVAIENARIVAQLEERVRHRTAELEAANRAIHLLSVTDELTGLLNRRGFLEQCQRAWAGAVERAEAATVLFADVDNLKAVNDRLGHGAGDELLRAVADAMVRAVRPAAAIARYGGDEFCAFLLSREPTGSRLVERLASEISATNRARRGPRIELSVGCISAPARSAAELEVLLGRADAEMYAMKRRASRGRAHFAGFATASRTPLRKPGRALGRRSQQTLRRSTGTR